MREPGSALSPRRFRPPKPVGGLRWQRGSCIPEPVPRGCCSCSGDLHLGRAGAGAREPAGLVSEQVLPVLKKDAPACRYNRCRGGVPAAPARMPLTAPARQRAAPRGQQLGHRLGEMHGSREGGSGVEREGALRGGRGTARGEQRSARTRPFTGVGAGVECLGTGLLRRPLNPSLLTSGSCKGSF